MTIFYTDLDNTIIYSYKHDIGNDKICAEIYQGREISFVTAKTADLLKKINEKILIVPTTTRTIEQYKRIDLGIGTPEYALVCNGGVLLTDGEEDDPWYRESREIIAECDDELLHAQELLEKDEHRTLDVRFIKELFIFTKSDAPQRTIEQMKDKLDTDKLDIFMNGVKVYAVPKKLNKGLAVKRLAKKLGAKKIIAAGDSEFDVTLLNAADIALAPRDFPLIDELSGNPEIMSDDGLFSEYVLEKVLSETKTERK
ncbi:MAG: HAD hydrolase family protein [Clostridia bacterium]|nr:HAD hydrolase family protein [Clostridia bacterium]